MPFYASDRGFRDPHVIRRFGNLTASAASEVLVSARAYVAQSSEAQRSVKSSNAQDNPAGTGAKVVRITYLTSNYELKTEDVTLNGVTAVNTVGTDIRFIECFDVIQGAAAVGVISLMTQTGGAGTEFCGIPAATTQSFMCHHYVPAGKQAWILAWGSTVDDECNLKLLGQARPDGTNLVDRVHDLENLRNNNLLALSTMEFHRELGAVLLPEKTYGRVTVVPNQATATIIRSWSYFWEESTV